MEVRELSEEEFRESLKLSMYAFQYTVPEADIPVRIEKLRNQKVLGIWQEKSLAAKLQIIPLKIFMKEAEWKMGGIAGVAAYPEYRRSGFVNTLITSSLKHMRADGQIASFLHPFNISFYRKFGWEIFNDHKYVTIDKINLQFLEAQKGFIRRYTKENHCTEIENLYREFCSQYAGMLVRDSKWWKEHVYNEHSQLAVYYNSLNEATGYILYQVRDRKMEVKELAALDQEARTGLWNFICQHDSMVETVTMKLSSQDPFPYFLPQPKLKIEITPYFMARVVDAEECLKIFPFLPGYEPLFLHLEDRFAPWNNGSYLLNKGEVTVFKDKEGSRCAHPPKRGIQLTINTLSAILFGYKRPMELYEMGYLKGSSSEMEKLEALVPVMKPSFFDFF